MRTPNFIWKVVLVEASPSGTYRCFSSGCGHPNQLEYKIGQKTEAKYGLLFAFRRKKDALAYLNNRIGLAIRSSLGILKAIPHGKAQAITHRCHWRETRYKEFWKLNNDWRAQERYLKVVPVTDEGIIGIPALTPIQFV